MRAANAISLTGATPVFADIGNDLNIDPKSIRPLIGKRTKAIVPVHYTGKICRMPEIIQIAEQHNLVVVEDAAQAIGANLDGKPSGSFGTLASFSMNSMKILASCGEAGAIVTDSEPLYNRLVSLRYNGTVNRETCLEPSLNSRMDTLQAAILLKRMEHLPQIIERRREIATKYNNLLGGIVEVPLSKINENDVFYTYTIKTKHRDKLAKFLAEMHIETKIQHPILMPEQPYYKRDAKGVWKNAKRIVKEILSIPANEKLTDGDIIYIADLIRKFFSRIK